MIGAVGMESAVSSAKFGDGDQLGYKLGIEYAKRFFLLLVQISV